MNLVCFNSIQFGLLWLFSVWFGWLWFCFVCLVQFFLFFFFCLDLFGFVSLFYRVWLSMVWFDLVWFGSVWLTLVWFGCLQSGLVKFGSVNFVLFSFVRTFTNTKNKQTNKTKKQINIQSCCATKNLIISRALAEIFSRFKSATQLCMEPYFFFFSCFSRYRTFFLSSGQQSKKDV